MRQKSAPRVKSGTDFFLRPGEPHHLRRVLDGRKPGTRSPNESLTNSPSSANSPALFVSPRSAAVSASTTAAASASTAAAASASTVAAAPVSPRRAAKSASTPAPLTPRSAAKSASTAAPLTPGSAPISASTSAPLTPRSAAVSASAVAPFTPRSRTAETGEEAPKSARAGSGHKTEFGSFDLLCLGGTLESLAAATEAAALHARVCLVEPFAGVDSRAVFRLALRSCLRRELGVGQPGIISSSFEELRKERELCLERLGSTRRGLVKKGVVVLTCSTASFQSPKGGQVGPFASPQKLAKSGASASSSPSPRRAKEKLSPSSPPTKIPSSPSGKDGLHVLLANATQARIGTVSASHYLIAAGERSLIQGTSSAEQFEGRELCTQPEDLLDALPAQGPHRICIIGTSWTAVELCAFCELAGAEVTWFIEPADSNSGEDPLLVEMLPRLVHQVKVRGRTTVHTDFNSRFIRVVQRGTGETSQPSSSSSPTKRQSDKLLYVQAKHSGADCCGPFDVVLLFGKSDPVLHGIGTLPGVALGKDGRLLVDANGAAGPQISAIGEVATQRLIQARSKHDAPNNMGIVAFGADEQGLLSQGRRFAQLLFGGPGASPLVAPALRITTALSYPPVGLVGLSGDEAHAVFPAPTWSVSVCFSRHELLGGICGHFVVGLTCVQRGTAAACGRAAAKGPEDAQAGSKERAKEGDDGEDLPFVAGAALLVESGGLPLISGLLLGFAVAVEGRVSQRHFDRILAAYPMVDQAQ